MTKTKNFITNLTKLRNEANGSALLPDPSHVMLCSIHNSVKSTSDFPQCEHKKLRLCSARSHSFQKSNRAVSRTRRRSKTPPSRMRKGQDTSGQNWTTLKTSATLRNSQNEDTCPSCEYSSQICRCPLTVNSSYLNVEKTRNFPTRTCSCLINRGKPDLHSQNSIKSQSTLFMSNTSPAHNQIAHSLIYADEVVTELKGELEKVKSQLLQISVSKGLDIKKDSEILVSQLKMENKYLKKELEEKKKNQNDSLKDVEKAKEIMSDYEKKVLLLHEQAIKSSKLMKQSKEKFCKCLKEKENQIKDLQQNKKELTLCVKDKDIKYLQLNNAYEDLHNMYRKIIKKCDTLEESNKKFCQCVEDLEDQLQKSLQESEQYKEDMEALEKKMSALKCELCQKLEIKIKKQKEKYENRLKEYEESEKKLKHEILILSSKMKETESEKLSLQKLEGKYNELQNKLLEYEKCASRCKTLEDECKRQTTATTENEKCFERERYEMRKLVEELTTVVKHNKVTLLKLSNINKQQEALLESQSTILSQKEEKMKQAESTIELLRKTSLQLEEEVNDLKRALSGPCKRDCCLKLLKQLDEVTKALNYEKDNHLVKEKVIEDQSQTICCLQFQIKEKMSELSKAREENAIAENEIVKMNNDLFQKHQALERELNEKDLLLKKLKKLEYQKTLLSREMEELQGLLQQYCESEDYNEEEREAIANLQKQVEIQRVEWEAQKENLANEKELAIRAAKFATQKLLDTVNDFQKQVDTQKKVQNMLTKMLHDKENELKVIKSKIFSINSITSDLEFDVPLNEIFKRNNGFELSNPATTSSFYSSYSNGSGSILKSNNEETDVNLLQPIGEVFH